MPATSSALSIKFVKINLVCQGLWGYNPVDLLGRSVMDIIVPQKRRASQQLFEQAFENSELADLEFSVAKADGNPSDSLWSSYYSRHERNPYWVVHDITEGKQIERLKQAFLTMMSSDLRQPLSKISEDIGKLLVSRLKGIECKST